jgi:hypothetical protein
MVADYHATFRKMKPTAGLTRFCCLMNLCEKTAVSTNGNAGFSLFKKVMFLAGVKNLFFLHGKRVVFLRRQQAKPAPDIGQEAKPRMGKDEHGFSFRAQNDTSSAAMIQKKNLAQLAIKRARSVAEQIGGQFVVRAHL